MVDENLARPDLLPAIIKSLVDRGIGSVDLPDGRTAALVVLPRNNTFGEISVVADAEVTRDG